MTAAKAATRPTAALDDEMVKAPLVAEVVGAFAAAAAGEVAAAAAVVAAAAAEVEAGRRWPERRKGPGES